LVDTGAGPAQRREAQLERAPVAVRDQEHTGRIEDRGARRSIGRRRVLRSQGDDERQQRAERGAEYRAHFGFTIAMPVAVSTGFTTGAVTAAAASGLPACS